MCEKCFENEIEQFGTAQNFKNFETELEKKLRQTNALFFFRQSDSSEPITYSIYCCKNCKAKWHLSMPYTLESGFLLMEDTGFKLMEKIKKSEANNRLWTSIIAIVILLICLLYIVNHI